MKDLSDRNAIGFVVVQGVQNKDAQETVHLNYYNEQPTRSIY